MKKNSSEIIFTFQGRCRYWLRFPELKEKKLSTQIKKLQTERVGGAEIVIKPLFSNGEQSELAVVDVFVSPSGYEYRLGKIPIAEDSVYF